EDDALTVALEALDGGLVARVGFHQGHDDVVELRAILTAHQHEIAVADVRADHALAAHAQRKEIFTTARQRTGRDRQLSLAILLGEQWLPGRDAAENGHTRRLATAARRLGQRETSRGPARRRASLQHALALERTEMIERRARRDAKLLADLPHRRRHAVPRGEASDEVEHVTLPCGQLSHSRPPMPG